MRELIGIDTEGLYRPALNLLGRLAFEGSEWQLAHMEAPLAIWAPPEVVFSDELLREAIQADRVTAEKALDTAVDEACAYGVRARTHKELIAPSKGLMQLAEETKADLVAVGSRGNGRLSSAVLGSVGRALAIGGKQSLLVGRGSIAPTGLITAVFATDHSLYAQRALDWLIAAKPRGLKSITLVTAYAMDPSSDGGHFVEINEAAIKEGVTIHNKLRDLSEAAVLKLRAAGFVADYSLKPGKINDVINRSMELEDANLLIMGAQGHGFFERLLLGSVALHQVVAEPHSVLIIRPDANKSKAENVQAGREKK